MSKAHAAREEARKFPRVSENCRIRYRLVEDEALQQNGRSVAAVNISGGGVRFTTDTPLPAGRVAVLELDLPGMPSGIVAIGKVVWSGRTPGGAGFENGVEFWWVGWRAEDVQQAMLDYVSTKLSAG